MALLLTTTRKRSFLTSQGRYLAARDRIAVDKLRRSYFPCAPRLLAMPARYELLEPGLKANRWAIVCAVLAVVLLLQLAGFGRSSAPRIESAPFVDWNHVDTLVVFGDSYSATFASPKPIPFTSTHWRVSPAKSASVRRSRACRLQLTIQSGKNWPEYLTERYNQSGVMRLYNYASGPTTFARHGR